MEAAYGHEQSAERDTGLRSCLSLLQALHGMLATVTQQADALVGKGGGKTGFQSLSEGGWRMRPGSGAGWRRYTHSQ